MGVNPRQEAVVELLKDDYILLVVSLHHTPRFLVVLHALDPQLVALVSELGAETEELTHVVELVGREFELLANDSQQVDLLKWRWRMQSELEKFLVQRWYIEAISVVVHHHVSLV